MKSLTNDNASQRIGIFLAFALIFVVLVEVALVPRPPARAPLEDRPMSASVLFDAPVPGPLAATASTRSPPAPCWRSWSPSWSGASRTRASSPTPSGSRSITPSYVEVLLDGARSTPCDGLQRDPARRVVFGLVFGIGKLSDARVAALAELGRRGVLPRRAGAAADDLHLLPVRRGHPRRLRRLLERRGRRWRSTTAPCSPRSSGPASTRCPTVRPRRPTPSACARPR